MQVQAVMTPSVVTVAPDEAIEAVLKRWQEHPIGGFPVVEAGRVIGMLTESDLVYRERPFKVPAVLALFDSLIPLEMPRRFQREVKKTFGSRVRDVMTTPALTIAPEADIAQAARLMTERKVSRLPVIDAQGQLVGIVSRADLVRALISHEP